MDSFKDPNSPFPIYFCPIISVKICVSSLIFTVYSEATVFLQGITTDLLSAGYAESTKRSRQSAWALFVRFCNACEVPQTPPSERLFMWFASWMFDKNYAVGTIHGYVHALPSYYATLGIAVSVSRLECPSLALLFRGIRRKTQRSSEQKLPFTPAILIRFKDCLNFNSSYDIAIWATLLIGFWGFLRSDNLVPKGSELFDTSHAVLVSDFNFFGNGCEIKLRRSKTNQFGERHHFVFIPRIKSSRLCPVCALKTLFRRVSPSSARFAFSFSSDQHLTYRGLLKKIRVLCASIGLDPASYGTHSCRIGGASWAAANTVEMFAIKEHGGWASSCFLHYISLNRDQKLSAMSCMARGVLDPNLVRLFGPN
jgi:hypothetical protein